MPFFSPSSAESMMRMSIMASILLCGTALLAFILIVISRWTTEGIPVNLTGGEYDPPQGDEKKTRRRKTKARIPFPETRELTPTEVLDIIRTVYNRGALVDWTENTTIREAFYRFRYGSLAGEAIDLRPKLCENFHTWLGEISFAKAIQPDDKKTLGDLARFVAQHARVPLVDPPTPETAFDIVRRIFAHHGANIANMTPSTRLQPYLIRYYSIFATRIVPLGLGTVPQPSPPMPPRAVRYAWSFGAGYFGLAFLVMTIEAAIERQYGPLAVLLPLTLLIWSVPAVFLFAPWLPLFRTKLGQITTFGELSRVIAAAHQESSPTRFIEISKVETQR